MNQSAPRPRIAFLGIGLMGNPMATRLLNADFALTVWNRSRAKADVDALGARIKSVVYGLFPQNTDEPKSACAAEAVPK